MRVWIWAAVIAILAGALQAGNWSGHDNTHVVSSAAPGVALNGGAEVFGAGRTGEFAFMQLMRDAGAGVANGVGRVGLGPDQDFSNAPVNVAMPRDSGTIYGFGAAPLFEGRLSASTSALRQVFDDISQSGLAALPAIDRFSVRVSFGF